MDLHTLDATQGSFSRAAQCFSVDFSLVFCPFQTAATSSPASAQEPVQERAPLGLSAQRAAEEQPVQELNASQRWSCLESEMLSHTEINFPEMLVLFGEIILMT